jgi:hypothetical protein
MTPFEPTYAADTTKPCVSQRHVISYVLDLPFGRGKRYANDFSGFKNGLISGWGIDGVTTLQSGFQ